MNPARPDLRRPPLGKRIELYLRRRLIAMLGRRGGRASRVGDGHAPIALPERPRILLLRHDRIGDAIISAPVVTMLRARYPQARIEMLLGRKNRIVAPLLPDVDETLVLPGSLGGMIGTVRELRRRNYDLAINLLAKDSASGGMLTALSGARRAIGFQGELAAIYDTAVAHPDRPEHIVAETTRLLAPLGIEPLADTPEGRRTPLAITMPEEARREAEKIAPAPSEPRRGAAILLNISTPGEARRWPAARWAELAHVLAADGREPLIASTPADAAEAAAIAAEAGLAALPTSDSLATFAALLAGADLVVTPDTSIVHIAAALGRPTVVLNTEAEAASGWTPWGVPFRLLCGKGAVADIPVADAVAAVRSLLEEIATSHQPSTRV